MSENRERDIAREAYEQGLSDSPDMIYNPITQEWRKVLICPACGGPHRLPCPEADRVVPLQEVEPQRVPASAEEWLEDMRRQIARREQEEADGVYTDPENPHNEVP